MKIVLRGAAREISLKPRKGNFVTERVNMSTFLMDEMKFVLAVVGLIKL